MVDCEETVFTKSEKRAVLIASCLAIFINPMVGSMLNLALTAIGNDLQCSAHQLGWISSMFFIASVMALVPASRLSDIYGKKRIFKIGILICTLGLAMSSLSPNIYFLYATRCITGVGTAMVACNSVSMISDVYARHERGAALSVNTACVYVGASVGPTFGGIFTDLVGWRICFLIIIPLLLGALYFINKFKYNIKPSEGGSFDSKGSVVYAMGILIFMLGLISLPEIYAFVLIVLGVVVMVGFVIVEMRTKEPVMKVRMFGNTRFTRSLLALFFNYAASYSISFFLSLYFQSIGAMTATQAGMVLMVQPVIQVLFTLMVGKIVDRLDYRILPTLGMAILSIGIAMMLALGEDVNLPYAVLCLAINGIGFGLFSSPNTTATMSYVEHHEYSAASALISTMRQIGMMFSMGIATCMIAIFMGSTATLAPENYSAFIKIMDYTWYICLGFSVVGMLFSVFRGRPKNISD